MSYLNLPNGVPNFSKAVLSLWFRVPKSSTMACAAAAQAALPFEQLNPPHLLGIVPLVTFGAPLTTPSLIIEKQGPWDSWRYYDPFITGPPPTLCPVVSYRKVSEGDAYIDPSYLGMSLSFDFEGNPTVAVVGNFQTTAMPTVGGEFVISGCTLHYGPGPPGGNPSYDGATTTWAEYSPPQGPQAYYFELPYVDTDSFADRWHHLLVSCDLSSSVSTNSSGATIEEGVTSYNRMWVALDDVNFNGYDAFPNFVEVGDLNAVITDAAYDAAASSAPPRDLPLADIYPTEVTRSDGSTHIISGQVPLQNIGDDGFSHTTTDIPVTCTVPSAAVPALGHSFGLPATADQVDHIFHVEMAEFQMFTDVTLDTSKTDNRRVFITEKGKPVPPEQKTDPNNPDSRPGSVEFFGKQPDVLLHKSAKWIKGKNTGTIGDFDPTGEIKKYKPDPSLHGPQSPEEVQQP